MLFDDELQKIYGTVGIRKLLSSLDTLPPIQEVIDANLVPKLVEFMQDDSNPDLQVEATQALANVAADYTTEHTQYIVDKGAIPAFVRLLSSPRQELVLQTIWGIAYIAGYKKTPTFRDVLIDSGALELLIKLVDNSSNEEIVQRAAAVINNLSYGSTLERVKSAIPTLCRVLLNRTNLTTLEFASNGLQYVTKRDPEISHDLVKQLIPCLLKYIDNPNHRLSWSCLDILVNLSISNINQEIALVDPTYLPKLFKLACGLNRGVGISALRIISNITAGHSNLIQSVIGDHYYVDMIIKFTMSNDTEIQLEAGYVLTNAITESTSRQIAEMIDLGVLDCLLYLFDSKDVRLVYHAAMGVSGILNKEIQMDQVGRVANAFLFIFRDKGADKHIERLQTHSDGKISSIAKNILDRHF